MDRDTKDILKGALVNSSGIILRSVNFIFYVFLSQVYGAVIVGVFVVSRSIVDIISKLGILGLDRGILSIVAKLKAAGDEQKLYRSIGQAMTLGCIVTIFVILLTEGIVIPLINRFYYKSDLVLSLRIMALGMLFWTISAILLFATRALRIMKYEVIVKNGIEPVTIFLFAIVFYKMKMGILGLSLAFLISVIVGTGFSFYYFARVFSVKKLLNSLFSIEGRKQLLFFALPIGLYDALNLFLQRIDLFILAHFTGDATVGVYSMAQNAAFTFKKVRQSFDPIFIPVISASSQLRDRQGLIVQYQNVTRWILVINIAFFSLTIFAAESIMGIFGKDFTAGSQAFIILTAAIMVNTILGVSELFILINKPLINLLNTIFCLILGLILNFVLVPVYGMLGASISVFTIYILMNTARLIETWFLYKLHPFTRYHLRALLAAAPAFGIGFFIKTKVLKSTGVGNDLLTVLIFLIFFLSALRLLGMAKEDRIIVSKLWSVFKIKQKINGED